MKMSNMQQLGIKYEHSIEPGQNMLNIEFSLQSTIYLTFFSEISAFDILVKKAWKQWIVHPLLFLRSRCSIKQWRRWICFAAKKMIQENLEEKCVKKQHLAEIQQLNLIFQELNNCNSILQKYSKYKVHLSLCASELQSWQSERFERRDFPVSKFVKLVAGVNYRSQNMKLCRQVCERDTFKVFGSRERTYLTNTNTKYKLKYKYELRITNTKYK